MNIDDFKYYTTINGLKGYSNCKDSLVGEMVRDYNIAHQNLITRFSVIRNTIDGKDIYVNFSDTPIRGVIDTKKKNGATSDMEEVVQVEPNLIKRGDYISFKYNETDELHTYIVTSRIEKKNGYDEGIFLYCNNTLNAKGWDKPIWGYFTNSSFGVKGVLESEYLSSVDGKLKGYVKDNETTFNIPIGMRFIFDFDEKEVYKVIKSETITTGKGQLRVIAFDKTETTDKDDFVNNIAYNSFQDSEVVNPPTPTNTYNIVSKTGVLSIKMFCDNTFKIVDSNGIDDTNNWTITVDQTGLASGFITIKSITNNSVTILNNNGYSRTSIKIKFTKGSDVLEKEVRLVK